MRWIPVSLLLLAPAVVGQDAVDVSLVRRAGDRVLLRLDLERDASATVERPGAGRTGLGRLRIVRELLDEVDAVADGIGHELLRGRRTFRRYEIDRDGRADDPEVVGRTLLFDLESGLPEARLPEGQALRPALLARLADQADSLAAFASLPDEVRPDEPFRADVEGLARLLLDVDGERRGASADLRLVDAQAEALRVEGDVELRTRIDVDGVSVDAAYRGGMRLEIDPQARALRRVEWSGGLSGEGARGGTRVLVTGTFQTRLEAVRGRELNRALRRSAAPRPVPRAFEWLTAARLVLPPAWYLVDEDDMERRARFAHAEHHGPDGPLWILTVALVADDGAGPEAAFEDKPRRRSIRTRIGKGERLSGRAEDGRALLVDRIPLAADALLLRLEGPVADERALERVLSGIERLLAPP